MKWGKYYCKGLYIYKRVMSNESLNTTKGIVDPRQQQQQRHSRTHTSFLKHLQNIKIISIFF
jgi:hypothetical protein